MTEIRRHTHPAHALHRAATLALCLLLLGMLGCQPTQSRRTAYEPHHADRHVSLQAPTGMEPVQTLAYRLNMRVEASTRHWASLTDGTNVVVLVAPPGPRATLNGRYLQPPAMWQNSERLYVSTSFADVLARELRQAKAEPPSRRVIERQAPSRKLDPPPLARVGGTVMIDAGHGGKDPGALNRYGINEKHVVLDVSLRVARQLKSRGVRVLMTRTGDSYPTLQQRVEYANKTKPDLFVSIHADAAQSASASGYTIYVARQSSQASKDAASYMLRSLGNTGARSRGVRKADFIVIAQTHCPAILVELGYISNPTEGRQLSTAGYRSRLADAVSDGIIAWLQSR